jgi:hypothetical protein
MRKTNMATTFCDPDRHIDDLMVLVHRRLEITRVYAIVMVVSGHHLRDSSGPENDNDNEDYTYTTFPVAEA